MKRFLIIALVGWVLSGAYTADAAQIESSTYEFQMQSRSDRKEARAYRRELRRARRAEYRSRTNNGTETKDYSRSLKRANYKQRKKIDKAARKENRRKWGSNELGDVFSVY